ncbi:PREDICTED: sensory neuron membrane protein 2-like [Polistes dominula]|uniref:Sensory neuron membrane protein 2-like n=1 Tax=Polistes dominula TaxID=743375 RepID=A0ABM1IBV8_POLDO|nr:PREDICTED: sensory neuron membrane protein 2-like [Polistes dominula]
MDNTKGYEIWSYPEKMTFTIYLFHVENPDDVLLGERPRLIERGPYVYEIIVEKEILSVNEIRDEITFNIKKTYYYNDEESGELSENDEVVIINMAYLGAINTVT